MTLRCRVALLVILLLLAVPTPAWAQKPPPKVPDGVVFEPDIEYANPDDQHLKLDLARPKEGDGPFPAILCIHGGGFRAGSRQGYDALCMRLAEHGYVAVTVEYRLAPKYQFPAAIYDVKAAVRWLRANARKYKIDPNRIGTHGGSAGGHLAQFLAVTPDVKQFEGDVGNADQSSRVACVVNFFGPSDFTKSYGKSVDAAEVLPLWLGGNLEKERHKHIIASPLYWVTPSAAPTLCVHGTEDKYVAHEQAVWLIDKLKAADVEAELLTLQGAGHGFKGEDAEKAEKALFAFFDKHLLKKEKAAAGEEHRLYVVTPGIRNYLEVGGAGVLVFDMDHDYKLIKRIETPASLEEKPDNIKGVCACAATKKLYFTTTKKLYCLDLATEKTLWEKALPGGTDRMSMTPDGKVLYVPSFEGPHWNAVDAASGDVLATVETNSGAHNTVCGRDGKRMYLAGLKSPILRVADPTTHKLIQEVGPFSGSIRPFTVNAAQTLCFVNVNGLLGFEIGDLKTGKMLHRVEVEGFKQGTVKRHGCPSHGIGLTPDEKEVWVCDAANSHLHIFDATLMPPKQVADIKLRDEPGWVTFSLDGKYAYPSTGEVIDTKTLKIIATLADEKGREVHSEKLVEIVFKDGTPVRTGDQFGVGRAGEK